MLCELTLFSSLGKCVGYSLELLDIILKIWAPLRKLFAPPNVPSWLRACLGAVLSGISALSSGVQTFLSEEHFKEFAKTFMPTVASCYQVHAQNAITHITICGGYAALRATVRLVPKPRCC